MIRVILPLLVIAAIVVGPIYNKGPSYDDVQKIETVDTVSGYELIKPAINCWRTGNISIADECEPAAGMKGKALAGAVALSAVAAALGILGIFPFVGRLTSIVTVLAGVGALGAAGYFATTLLGTDGGVSRIEWGSYLTGGAGLLTVISGLSGMRGR